MFPVQSGGVSCTNVCLDTFPIHARYKHNTNARIHVDAVGYMPVNTRYGADTSFFPHPSELSDIRIGYDRIRSDTCTRFFRTGIVYHVYPYPVDTDTCISRNDCATSRLLLGKVLFPVQSCVVSCTNRTHASRLHHACIMYYPHVSSPYPNRIRIRDHPLVLTRWALVCFLDPA